MKEYRKLSKTDYIRIANYYYNRGLTQEQIASVMNLSRQRINRVLGQCLKNGIVKISVEGLDNTHVELENSLETRFGLKSVRIAEAPVSSDIYAAIGREGALYLASLLKSGDTVGFSRGRTVSALADSMPETEIAGLTVTQLMGGHNNEQSKVNVDDIVHRFARQTGGNPTMLFAPVVVNSPEVKDAIRQEPFFRETYEIIKNCTIAVVGIGDTSYKHASDASDSIIQSPGGAPAAGEICTHYYTESGEALTSPLADRVIAIELEDYRAIPLRIGVAGKTEKIPAILGALRGGYINALVTDADTAEELLKR